MLHVKKTELVFPMPKFDLMKYLCVLFCFFRENIWHTLDAANKRTLNSCLTVCECVLYEAEAGRCSRCLLIVHNAA